MDRLTDKTMVPLSWTVGAIILTLSSAVGFGMYLKGTNDWAAAVDARLSRIEKHLHIDSPTAAAKPPFDFFTQAQAGGPNGPNPHP